MVASWLAAFASRLLREDTFQLMVAPAIAGLQFERPVEGRLRRAASCLTVWWVIA